MIALISPAKTMQDRTSLDALSELYTEPRFREQTDYIVSLMVRYSAFELVEIFRVSKAIARELQRRFMGFFDDEVKLLPAVDSYDGVVYKHFKGDVNAEYLQERVRISSLLYGLLRPFDLIQPYRMERL